MSQAQCARQVHQASLGYSNIEERATEELVFVFVEPLGGGAKQAFDTLEGILKENPYNYCINRITTREIIKEQIDQKNSRYGYPGEDVSKMQTDRGKHILSLQEQGNWLRKKFGNDFIAKQIIIKIADYRKDNNGFEQAEKGSMPVPKSIRVAHIVRSIKHEDELERLKSVYGKILFVIGVTGDYETRFRNFIGSTKTQDDERRAKADFDLLSEKDQFEGLKHGQRVRKVYYRSDFFLDSSTDNIKESLTRFIELLFDQSIITPRFNERMMHVAYTSSLMSLCLSRQVGAAIANDSKELIAVGWNDIPRFGGGLSSDEVSDKENKSLCKYIGYCNTNKKIDELIHIVYDKLGEDLLRDVRFDDFKEKIKETPIVNLIEFSRSIHAEMAAILSVAREGSSSLRGATLYVTTYPCENCIKHILASGISRVYYIEPYPKSRAKEFYQSMVSEHSSSSRNNDDCTLNLIQYSGVSPTSYELLYKATKRKDDDGNVYHNHSKSPKPKTKVYLDSFTVYEAYVAKAATKEDSAYE